MRKLQEAILPISLRTWLDAAAHNLDTAPDNAAALLPKLAEAGLFGLGVPALLGGHGGHVHDAIAGVAGVSERSLAAGFVFWGHRTFIEYLLQSPNETLRDRLLPDLLAGSRAGATGLSNAMKFLSGIEGLQIKSTKIGAWCAPTVSFHGSLTFVCPDSMWQLPSRQRATTPRSSPVCHRRTSVLSDLAI
jgi:alkylation response protein AidB-like acyl-CoA dehydrogenase